MSDAIIDVLGLEYLYTWWCVLETMAERSYENQPYQTDTLLVAICENKIDELLVRALLDSTSDRRQEVYSHIMVKLLASLLERLSCTVVQNTRQLQSEWGNGRGGCTLNGATQNTG